MKKLQFAALVGVFLLLSANAMAETVPDKTKFDNKHGGKLNETFS